MPYWYCAAANIAQVQQQLMRALRAQCKYNHNSTSMSLFRNIVLSNGCAPLPHWYSTGMPMELHCFFSGAPLVWCWCCTGAVCYEKVALSYLYTRGENTRRVTVGHRWSTNAFPIPQQYNAKIRPRPSPTRPLWNDTSGELRAAPWAPW